MGLDSEKTRNLLNKTGFPFQHWCASKIRELEGYRVAVEVPFTQPQSNGPILGSHGTFDMVAMHAVSDGLDKALLFFIIECKKASADIKNWIFMIDKNKAASPLPAFVFSQVDEDLREAKKVTRHLTYPNLNFPEFGGYDFCVHGFEVNSSSDKINRNAENKIYKPLKQAVHGCYAFENKTPKVVEGLIQYFRNDDYKYFIFQPIVLTTANLYIADYDCSKIISGEVQNNDVDFGEPKKWLSYEFPLPDYLSYGAARNTNIVIERRTVFVVNENAIEEFFNGAHVVYNYGTELRSEQIL